MHYFVKASLLADLFSLLGLPDQKGGPPTSVQSSDTRKGCVGFECLTLHRTNPWVMLLMRIWPRLRLLQGSQSLACAAAAAPYLVDTEKYHAQWEYRFNHAQCECQLNYLWRSSRQIS